MANLLKTGAKNPSGVAMPISCDADGALIEQRKWSSTATKVYEEVISDTNNHKTTALDISDAGLVSIRLSNRSGVALSVIFYGDDDVHNNSGLRDLNGELITIHLPAGAYFFIITPNDVPMLNYLRKLRLGITADDTPIGTNATEVYVITKK